MQQEVKTICTAHDLLCITECSVCCDVMVHIHDAYEIYQALGDNIRYFVEGHVYDLACGDIIITNTKDLHRPVVVDNNPYHRRFVQFRPHSVQMFFDPNCNPFTLFERQAHGMINHIPVGRQSLEMKNAFDHIFMSYDTGRPLQLAWCKTYLVQFLLSLYLLCTSDAKANSRRDVGDTRIQRVKAHLDDHFTEPFYLEDLAAEHFMDKFHMSHLFKSKTGFTLLEYVQSRRMQLAMTLLQENVPITQVSRACGYDEYTNFYRTFRNLVQCSPKEYKSRNKEGSL